jgi:hypothetical protein|uniref:Uncharacterized protein n=1 Tax=viral metagenome TaxID=1070528 RepID=A0A6C0K3R3_9ZZZZ
MSYRVWSTAFSNAPVEETNVYVSIDEWKRIHDDQPEAQRIFARIMRGEDEAFCALGEPIPMDHFRNTENSESVIIPDWVRGALRIDGSGEHLEIAWLAEDSFPKATRVVLRPHDSALFHGDIKDDLERELTSYGVIMERTTIPVSLRTLGGFSILIDIIRTYPANIVLLDGDEIVFEFEASLDTPPPPTEAVSVLSEPVDSAPVGNRLGGVNHPPLPDGRPWNPWREV